MSLDAYITMRCCKSNAHLVLHKVYCLLVCGGHQNRLRQARENTVIQAGKYGQFITFTESLRNTMRIWLSLSISSIRMQRNKLKQQGRPKSLDMCNYVNLINLKVIAFNQVFYYLAMLYVTQHFRCVSNDKLTSVVIYNDLN